MELTAIVDCQCGTPYEVTWTDDSIDPEQMDEAPVTTATCPGCGMVTVDLEYPGWMYKGEAG